MERQELETAHGVWFVQFMGAMEGSDGDYYERGPIWINPARITAFYDHTILVDGYKIRVMDTEEEIVRRL